MNSPAFLDSARETLCQVFAKNSRTGVPPKKTTRDQAWRSWRRTQKGSLRSPSVRRWTRIVLKEALNPGEHFGNVNTLRVTDPAAIDVSDVRVDAKDRIRPT
jgi:hypothetical protein